MFKLLLLLALGLWVLAGMMWWVSRQGLHRAGMPMGEVVLSDTEMHPWQKPLVDHELGLSGRPDYVVRRSDKVWIPVEVKSSPAPPTPHASHVYQLVAYAILIRRVLGKQVPYGYIRYADRTFRLEITSEHEARLYTLLEEMRAYQARGQEPGRSHTSPARCRSCGYRHVCPFRLV